MWWQTSIGRSFTTPVILWYDESDHWRRIRSLLHNVWHTIDRHRFICFIVNCKLLKSDGFSPVPHKLSPIKPTVIINQLSPTMPTVTCLCGTWLSGSRWGQRWASAGSGWIGYGWPAGDGHVGRSQEDNTCIPSPPKHHVLPLVLLIHCSPCTCSLPAGPCLAPGGYYLFVGRRPL